MEEMPGLSTEKVSCSAGGVDKSGRAWENQKPKDNLKQ